MNNRTATFTTWIVTVLLSVAFLAAGAAKLTGQPMMREEFGAFGYPLWFMCLTGLIEVVNAVLVAIPRTSRIGAGLLICVMAGAIFSHLAHGQPSMIGAPVVLLILAAVELQIARRIWNTTVSDAARRFAELAIRLSSIPCAQNAIERPRHRDSIERNRQIIGNIQEC